MFEKVKKAWFEKGRIEGVKHGIDMATFPYTVGEHGITYATNGDYMKAKVAFSAKDAEIASLKEKIKELEGWKAASNKDAKETEASLSKCRKELEQFYLKAIGDCRTVKQVNAVVKQYTASSIRPMVYGPDIISQLKKFTDAIKGDIPHYQILMAAKTKIKRINHRDTQQLCTMLDTTTDRTVYASSMATALKGIADIEVDMTKVLAAKDSGLDAWNVLLSMLSAYGIKHDDVL